MISRAFCSPQRHSCKERAVGSVDYAFKRKMEITRESAFVQEMLAGKITEKSNDIPVYSVSNKFRIHVGKCHII
jgi:hypothetical protein